MALWPSNNGACTQTAARFHHSTFDLVLGKHEASLWHPRNCSCYSRMSKNAHRLFHPLMICNGPWFAAKQFAKWHYCLLLWRPLVFVLNIGLRAGRSLWHLVYFAGMGNGRKWGNLSGSWIGCVRRKMVLTTLGCGCGIYTLILLFQDVWATVITIFSFFSRRLQIQQAQF